MAPDELQLEPYNSTRLLNSAFNKKLCTESTDSLARYLCKRTLLRAIKHLAGQARTDAKCKESLSHARWSGSSGACDGPARAGAYCERSTSSVWKEFWNAGLHTCRGKPTTPG